MPTFLLYCERHRTAQEYHSEPMAPPPPPSHVCPSCLAEKAQKPAHLQPTVPSTVTKIADAYSDDEDFLAGVRNPEARRVLAERRELDRQRLQQEAEAIDTLDHDRPLVVALDRAETVTERRRATRNLRRAARGPRWE